MASGDFMIAQDLVTWLTAKGKTLTTVESCTGGMLAAAITDISGASQVFEFGFVTYANRAKTQMVSVPETTLVHEGAVSQKCVEQMALGGCNTTGCDFAIAISGIAGPSGGSDAKPVGLVWMGFAQREGNVWTRQMQYGPQSRDAIRQAAMRDAFLFSLEILRENYS